jgi:hypothetical protein
VAQTACFKKVGAGKGQKRLFEDVEVFCLPMPIIA